MQAPYSAKPVTLSIAAVERDTGLSKDTLRVWERRYGFPTPQRDALGERSYPFSQVERLRTIKRLLDAGHRPGRIVSMAPEDLERLAAVVGLPAMPRAVEASAEPATDLSLFVEAVSRNDVDGLRRMLARSLSRLGLGHFVLDVVAPLNVQVGEAWMHGKLEVYQEHVYTESVQVVLRNALQDLHPTGTGRPRVLLATVTGEPHGLGLLMAEAILALEGCHCVSLGVQTPVWDVVRAATAFDVDIVALGYTGCTNPNTIVDGLLELRAKLAPAIDLWAGGSAPVLQRRAFDGLQAIPSLQQVAAVLAAWNLRHPR
jgi:methanogenic corrinoid protein MtbC1